MCAHIDLEVWLPLRTTLIPTQNPQPNPLKPMAKNDDFDGSIGMDVLNFIEPNFTEFILTPIRMDLGTQNRL